jgi:hypothetical protein
MQRWNNAHWAFLGLLTFGYLGAHASDLGAQPLTTDTLVASLRGDWQGSGLYEGNTLRLTRKWTLDLGDQFLRADMSVSMPNGASFAAVMYWKFLDQNVYEIVWMDGIGRRQVLRATRDPVSGVVSTTFLDELTGSDPEWRTWEFELLGPNSYVERLYRIGADGREELTVFSFARVGGL